MTTRAEKARATRRRVLDAACRLFVDCGYGATSVKQIAQEAQVGEQTVYFTFGTKVAVLAEVLDLAVAGDDEPVPTLDRPWALVVVAEPDPRRQLRLQAQGAADVLARVAAPLQALRAAADADPAAAELLARNHEQQRIVQRTFLAALATKTVLRRELEPAVDVATAVLSDHTFRHLIGAGWNTDDWVAFATDTLAANLLPEPVGNSIGNSR